MTCDYATVHNVPLCAHAPHCDATAHCPTMADPFCQRCSEPPDGVLPCNGCSVYDPDFSVAKGTRPQCPHEAPLSSICTFNPSFPEVFDSFEKNFTHQPKIVSASVRFQIISPFLLKFRAKKVKMANVAVIKQIMDFGYNVSFIFRENPDFEKLSYNVGFIFENCPPVSKFSYDNKTPVVLASKTSTAAYLSAAVRVSTCKGPVPPSAFARRQPNPSALANPLHTGEHSLQHLHQCSESLLARDLLPGASALTEAHVRDLLPGAHPLAGAHVRERRTHRALAMCVSQHCLTLRQVGMTTTRDTRKNRVAPDSIEWIVDSGASGMYTSDRSILTSVRPSTVRVSGANEHAKQMCAECQGDYGPFRNVTYIPSMAVNLLGVSQLKRQGFYVCLNALVISKGSHTFAIREDTVSGLYKVRLPRIFAPLQPKNHACVSYTSRNLAEIYHRRFNHISKRALINALKVHNISVPSRHFARMRMCDGCALGKATNAPVPSNMPRRAVPPTKPKPAKFTKPFELVCVDTAGPVSPDSHGGSRWMHVFKCKVTGYVHIACTRMRSGFYSEFVLFHRMLVIAQGFTIRVLRSDNAPELTMGAMVAYRAMHGITSQTSPPYSSFANGYAENAIRNASRVMRAMMAETAVPARYWSYCAMTYAHVFNRLPRLGKASPIALIKGRRPSVSYFRIFGCRCHVFIHPQERSKSSRFKPVSQPGTFLGFVPNSKSFFVDVRGKVYKRRSVSFNEDVDEFKNMHAPARKAHAPAMPLRGPVAGGDHASASPLPQSAITPEQHDCGSNDVTQPTANESKHNAPPDAPDAVEEITPLNSECGSMGDDAECGSYNGPDHIDAPMPSELDNAVDDHSQTPSELDNVVDEHTPIAPPSPLQTPASRYPNRRRVPPPRSHPVITGPQKYSGPLTRSKSSLMAEAFTCPRGPTRECRDNSHTSSFWDVANAEHVLTVVKASSVPTPRNYSEAMTSSHSNDWKQAVKRELDSMRTKRVWEVVPRTKQKPIGMRWVFKAKQDEHGNVIKFKGRLVAKGFAQRYGIDFFDVWAPVARYTTIRALLAFAAKEDLTLRQLDVDTAFLNAVMKETVYCTAPPGVKVPPGHVLLLKRSCYGTKQASRSWWLDIDSTFKNTLKMQPSAADPCLYYRYADGDMTFVALFVDDIIIASNSDTAIEEVKKGLEKHYSLTDQGELRWCLGMRVTRNRAARTIQLDQERYILDVLARFDMSDCKPVSTPMCIGVKLNAEQCPSTYAEKADLSSYHALYRSIVGSISYAALSTRPDVAAATIICAKYAHNPGREHLAAAKRILRFLAGTTRLCLTYGGSTMECAVECAKFDPRANNNLQMHGFCDSDWGGDLRTRKSTSGQIFFWNRGPISWRSKMQTCIAQSTAEAEYIAASEAAKEAKWLRLIIGVFEHKGREPTSDQLSATRIGCDNQAALAIIANPRCSARTKHIELRYHLVRDYAQRNIVSFHYVPTQCNIADLLTKPLNSVLMRRLCQMFMRELDIDPNDDDQKK